MQTFAPRAVATPTPSHRIASSATIAPATTMGALARFAIRARDDDDVPVWIAQPHLAVLRRGVHVRLLDDGCFQLSRSIDGGVEVIDLEPDEHAMSDGSLVSAR